MLLAALGACAVPSREGAPTAPQTRTEPASPATGVSATAYVDKRAYRVGEPIQLTVEIHNGGPHPITMVHPDYWGVSEIRVSDGAGRHREPTSVYKAQRKAVQATLTVEPGATASHTFEELTTFTCCYAYTYRSLPAGSYSVVVEIVNPPLEVEPPSGWSRKWEGRLTTPAVDVTIGR